MILFTTKHFWWRLYLRFVFTRFSRILSLKIRKKWLSSWKNIHSESGSLAMHQKHLKDKSMVVSRCVINRRTPNSCSGTQIQRKLVLHRAVPSLQRKNVKFKGRHTDISVSLSRHQNRMTRFAVGWVSFLPKDCRGLEAQEQQHDNEFPRKLARAKTRRHLSHVLTVVTMGM